MSTIQRAIICDIDGTLAHRGDRSPYDWHKVGLDSLDEAVRSVIYFLSPFYKIFLVSGRDRCCEPETLQWLRDNKVVFDALFMRPEGNNEKDSIIKERIYKENIEGFYEVLFVLDDRQQVVDMWRSIGLKCFQVAEGNF